MNHQHDMTCVGVRAEPGFDNRPPMAEALDAGICDVPPGRFELWTQQGNPPTGSPVGDAYNLDVPDGTMLCGAGAGRSTLVAMSPSASLLHAHPGADIGLRNLRLAFGVPQNGVKLYRARRVSLENVVVEGNGLYALAFYGCQFVSAVNTWVVDLLNHKRGFAFADVADHPLWGDVAPTGGVQLVNCGVTGSGSGNNAHGLWCVRPLGVDPALVDFDIQITNFQALNVPGHGLYFERMRPQIMGGASRGNTTGVGLWLREVDSAAVTSFLAKRTGGHGVLIDRSTRTALTSVVAEDCGGDQPGNGAGIMHTGPTAFGTKAVNCIAGNRDTTAQNYGFHDLYGAGGATVIGGDYSGNAVAPLALHSTSRAAYAAPYN